MSISSVIRILFALLLLLLPSWAIISAQIGHVIGFEKYVAFSRYLIVFSIIIFCTVGIVLSGGRLSYSLGFYLLLFYSVYIAAHIVGETEALLLLEGLRHEVLFVVVALLFLAYGLSANRIGFLPSLNVVVFTILLNGFFAFVFAIWQFFDINILEVLYRLPLEDIPHLKLAVGYRLTSTMINPINFGAYVVMCFISIQYIYDKKLIGSVVYYVLIVSIFFLVFGSLSRLALVSLIAVFLYFCLHKASVARFFSLLLLFVIAFFFVFGMVDMRSIMARVETLFVVSTYLENARVSNWVFAISSMEPYQYLWGRGIGASSPDSSILSVASAFRIENGFMSIFIQYGFIGLALIISISARFLYLGFRIIEREIAVGRFVNSFLLFFFVISLGNDFFRNSPFVFYFWFFYSYFEILYVRNFSSSKSDLD